MGIARFRQNLTRFEMGIARFGQDLTRFGIGLARFGQDGGNCFRELKTLHGCGLISSV